MKPYLTIHFYPFMNKNTFISFALVQILCLLLISSPSFGQGYGVKKIVIDAGHGGKDPGAIGYKKSKEKDIVLKVALLTGKYIEEYLKDVEVVYTRTDDTFIELKDRPIIANKAKADLFISIHANAAGNSGAYGAETFVLGTNRSESNKRVSQLENSVITFEEGYEEKYNGFDPNSPESYIIFNFMQNSHLEQSTTLATLIQNQYTKRVGRRDREVQQASFWVLSATSMPSILTELGFISNAKEERFLTSEEGQEFMASAIFRAVRDYKKEIDAKQSLTMTDVETNTQRTSIKTTEAPVTKGPTYSGVTYKLQIFSTSKVLKLDHRSIRDLKEVDYYVDGSMYKYTLGYSSNINEIKELKNKYKDDYKGCFIVAFQNGKHISMADARKIQAK